MGIDKIYDYCGKIPVFFDPGQRLNSILVSRGPIEKEPALPALVYWNPKTGENTNIDGTSYSPPKAAINGVKFVIAGTHDTIKIDRMIDEYFIEQRLK